MIAVQHFVFKHVWPFPLFLMWCTNKGHQSYFLIQEHSKDCGWYFAILCSLPCISCLKVFFVIWASGKFPYLVAYLSGCGVNNMSDKYYKKVFKLLWGCGFVSIGIFFKECVLGWMYLDVGGILPVFAERSF